MNRIAISYLKQIIIGQTSFDIRSMFFNIFSWIFVRLLSFHELGHHETVFEHGLDIFHGFLSETILLHEQALLDSDSLILERETSSKFIIVDEDTLTILEA